MSQSSRILVTGANGQLGRLVVDNLVAKVGAGNVVAMVRKAENGAAFAEKGVEVRVASYTDPASLAAAFAGIGKVLLISSSEVGQRAPQHQAVIDAAKVAGIGFIAYTSILRADTSILGLAAEHKATEAALKASGLPHAVLRNGWYTENYLGQIGNALAHGALAGAAGAGRISAATRADYAEAAAVVMAGEGHDGKIYELAGDEAFTLSDWTALLSKLSGKTVAYADMPEQAYAKLLTDVGLPGPFAALLADSDAGASKGALFDESKTLSRLIGRPTTSLEVAMSAALKG